MRGVRGGRKEIRVHCSAVVALFYHRKRERKTDTTHTHMLRIQGFELSD